MSTPSIDSGVRGTPSRKFVRNMLELRVNKGKFPTNNLLGATVKTMWG